MKLKSKLSVTVTLFLLLQLFLSCNVFYVQASDDATDEQIVVLHTSMGNITIKLREDMPVTAGNFLNLSAQGVYNNTIFHRIVNLPDSLVMIQGGDPTGTGYGDSSIPTIIDEFSTNPENNKNLRGTIAMANKGQPNTGSSQFFINGEYNSHLDNIHPVFGDVIEGMDVVDAILNVDTDANNRPLTDITLNGTQVIPEFPSSMILPLILIITMVSIIIKRILISDGD
jgi:peptidylprolyl isomerase